MQTVNRTQQNRTELVRIALGVVLLALVIGLWVCLWVPPLPIL